MKGTERNLIKKTSKLKGVLPFASRWPYPGLPELKFKKGLIQVSQSSNLKTQPSLFLSLQLLSRDTRVAFFLNWIVLHFNRIYNHLAGLASQSSDRIKW
jgi:hypothetical protein